MTVTYSFNFSDDQLKMAAEELQATVLELIPDLPSRVKVALNEKISVIQFMSVITTSRYIEILKIQKKFISYIPAGVIIA